MFSASNVLNARSFLSFLFLLWAGPASAGISGVTFDHASAGLFTLSFEIPETSSSCNLKPVAGSLQVTAPTANKEGVISFSTIRAELCSAVMAPENGRITFKKGALIAGSYRMEVTTESEVSVMKERILITSEGWPSVVLASLGNGPSVVSSSIADELLKEAANSSRRFQLASAELDDISGRSRLNPLVLRLTFTEGLDSQDNEKFCTIEALGTVIEPSDESSIGHIQIETKPDQFKRCQGNEGRKQFSISIGLMRRDLTGTARKGLYRVTILDLTDKNGTGLIEESGATRELQNFLVEMNSGRTPTFR